MHIPIQQKYYGRINGEPQGNSHMIQRHALQLRSLILKWKQIIISNVPHNVIVESLGKIGKKN